MNKRMITALCVALLGVARGIDAGNVCGGESSRKSKTKLNHDLKQLVSGGKETRFYPELNTIAALVSCGANPNLILNKRNSSEKKKGVEDNSKTLLCLASGKGKVSDVEELLRVGAKVNKCAGDRKNNPLCSATPYHKVVKVLLDHGADPNPSTLYSLPLIHAAFWAKPESVKLLLEYGARVNTKDSNGETSLQHAGHWISWSDGPELIKLLVDAGATG